MKLCMHRSKRPLASPCEIHMKRKSLATMRMRRVPRHHTTAGTPSPDVSRTNHPALLPAMNAAFRCMRPALEASCARPSADPGHDDTVTALISDACDMCVPASLRRQLLPILQARFPTFITPAILHAFVTRPVRTTHDIYEDGEDAHTGQWDTVAAPSLQREAVLTTDMDRRVGDILDSGVSPKAVAAMTARLHGGSTSAEQRLLYVQMAALALRRVHSIQQYVSIMRDVMTMNALFVNEVVTLAEPWRPHWSRVVQGTRVLKARD